MSEPSSGSGCGASAVAYAGAAIVVLGLAYALYPVPGRLPPHHPGSSPLPPVLGDQQGAPHVSPRLSREEAASRAQRTGAWVQVRGRLLESGDADAARWAEQLGPLIVALRPPLDNTDPGDPAPLERRLLTELQVHPAWLAIAGVGDQVTRIRALLGDQ